MAGTLKPTRLMSRLAGLILILAASSVGAHEIRPAVADLTIGINRATLIIDWALEAPVAGLDLAGIDDTNEAPKAERYDVLRALPPDGLATAFREAWPRIAEGLTLRAGDTPLSPELTGVTVPDVGDVTLPRQSQIEILLPLPADGTPLVLGWVAGYGPLVLRQMGVEDGYTAFLENGRLSDAIPRADRVEQSAFAAFVEYVGVGFDHIVPKGLDHVLFVLGLFFLALKLRPLLWQITAFTAAHTVTLALGALDIVRLPGEIVEPLIAASIVYVGVENVLSKGLTPWRPVVVFAFGLLHGLGFASVLTDFGLGSSHFVPKLIGFNVGVELGQLAVIAAAFLGVGLWFRQKPWYKSYIADPASIAIALAGAYWVIERTMPWL